MDQIDQPSEKKAIGDKLSLRHGVQVFLLGYFLILLIFGLFLTTKWTIAWTSYEPICIISRSIAISILGNSIFYARKLYKNMINQHYYQPGENGYCSAGETGATAYYIFRPLFAAALTVVVYYLIQGQIIFICDKLPNNTEKLGLFIITFSFFVGFSTGQAIEKLLSLSSKQIEIISSSCKN